MSKLGQFLAECCTEDWRSELPVDQLWQAYRQWCVKRGVVPAGRLDFELNLSEHGFVRTRRDATWIWGGVRLNRVPGPLAHV